MREVIGKTLIFFVATTLAYLVLSGMLLLLGQPLGDLELAIVLIPSILLGFYLAIKIGNRLFQRHPRDGDDH